MADIMNFNTLWLPFLTVWTGFGGLPTGPKILYDLAKNEWFAWTQMLLLALQGASGGVLEVSIVVTLLGFIIKKLLDRAYDSSAQECICPMPAPAPVPEEVPQEGGYYF